MKGNGINMSIYKLNKPKNLKEELGTDREVSISEPRIMQYPNSLEPDEKIIKISLELSFGEILEVRAAMAQHMQSMSWRNYHYQDLRLVQRILDKSLERFK
jgi:hypothetical protein